MKERFEMVAKIVDRAERMEITQGSRFTCMMDIEIIADKYNLDLEAFLNADDSNFSHDFIGIQNNIQGRAGGKTAVRLGNFFLPRFARV